MEKVDGNSNNSNGKSNAAVETHSVAEDSRMRARACVTAQCNKVDETQHEESTDFPVEKIDVLKKKTAEKPSKVFDNADIIVMSSSDGPKTDYEVQHVSAGWLVQNIDEQKGHEKEKATDEEFGNADMSFSEQSEIDFELEPSCDVNESDSVVDVEEFSAPAPTPSPPAIDLTPLWTEGPIVLNMLEMFDQQPEDVIRQLNLLHRRMPEYKYYDADFFE